MLKCAELLSKKTQFTAMSPTLIDFILVAVLLLSLAALLFAEYQKSLVGRALSKTLASACFVGLAWSLGALETDYGQTLFVGLVLCFLGDVLLIPDGQGPLFLSGIIAFLFAHVFYSVAFYTYGLELGHLVWGALLTVPVMLLVGRWLSPDLPADMRIAVGIYTVVIMAMLVFAGAANVWMFLPALMFAISDLSVARDRFKSAGFSNTVWGLPLYYFAQIGLIATLAL